MRIKMVSNLRINGSEQYKGLFGIRCLERVVALHHPYFVFFFGFLKINSMKVFFITMLSEIIGLWSGMSTNEKSKLKALIDNIIRRMVLKTGKERSTK